MKENLDDFVEYTGYKKSELKISTTKKNVSTITWSKDIKTKFYPDGTWGVTLNNGIENISQYPAAKEYVAAIIKSRIE